MKAAIHSLWLTGCVALAMLVAHKAQAEEPDQILFLHLKIKGDGVTCLSSSTTPGRLKTPVATERRGTLYLELVSTNGAAVWSDVIADPAVRRLEYEDPDHPGTLKIKEINLTEREFAVRVPFRHGTATLRVHRLEKPATRSEAIAQTGLLKPIANIALPGKETAP